MTRRYRVYIFDADGTLRWTRVPGQVCPYREGEWALMPNVQRVLSGIPWDHGAWLGIASNQEAVALGRLTHAHALLLIERTLAAAIGRLPLSTAIEMCVCNPELACSCRKPNPEMLLRIMRRFGALPQEAVFVGDLDVDREAAVRAGIDFEWARDFFGWGD